MELQERQEHIVKRCGPGGSKAIAQERKKEVDSLDGGDLIASRGKYVKSMNLKKTEYNFLSSIIFINLYFPGLKISIYFDPVTRASFPTSNHKKSVPVSLTLNKHRAQMLLQLPYTRLLSLSRLRFLLKLTKVQRLNHDAVYRTVITPNHLSRAVSRWVKPLLYAG